MSYNSLLCGNNVKIISTIIAILISVDLFAGEPMSIIDELLNKDNYSQSSWVERGLNPSPESVTLILNVATKDFLQRLKSTSSKSSLTQTQKMTEVSGLVDALPWDELDTEEKEFMADVLAPAIESLGLNPWAIF